MTLLAAPISAALATFVYEILLSRNKILKLLGSIITVGVLAASVYRSLTISSSFRGYSASHRKVVEATIAYSIKNSLPIYSVDGGQDRYFRFYGWATGVNFRQITDLEQVDQDGLLVLNAANYQLDSRIPRKIVVELTRNPPRDWKLVDRFDILHIFFVPSRAGDSPKDAVNFGPKHVRTTEARAPLRQVMRGFGPQWLNGDQLFFYSHEKAEYQINFAFDPSQLSEEIFAIQFTTAPDFSAVDFSINGNPNLGPIDLRTEKITTRCVEIPRTLLRAGDNILRLVLIPQEDQTTYRAGIDFIGSRSYCAENN